MVEGTNSMIGIIGGSSLYQLSSLTNITTSRVTTPYGNPSSDIIYGNLNGEKLAFIARHGTNHEFLPHEVNYRANIWALKSIGAKWVIAINATGSLKEEFAPGDIVIPDQLIDFTKKRTDTFFGEGFSAHPSLAHPYCPNARQAVIKAFEDNLYTDFSLHAKGTYICIEGPALSTKAESFMYRSWGADLIGMTNCPEAKLAREAGLAYCSICMITDYDCWKESEEEVTATAVFETMTRLSHQITSKLPEVVSNLSLTEPSDLARFSLKEALVTKASEIPKHLEEKIALLLKDC